MWLEKWDFFGQLMGVSVIIQNPTNSLLWLLKCHEYLVSRFVFNVIDLFQTRKF